MKSLAGQKTHFLTDEWIRLRRFLKTGRTQTVRDHAAEVMLRIEKELTARQCAKPKG